jgi:hypothetical protein
MKSAPVEPGLPHRGTRLRRFGDLDVHAEIVACPDRRAPVEDPAAEDPAGTHERARRHSVPPIAYPGDLDHLADRGDPHRDVQLRQHTLRVERVDVHVVQPRDDVFPRKVHDPCVPRDRHAPAKRRDPVTGDEQGLSRRGGAPVASMTVTWVNAMTGGLGSRSVASADAAPERPTPARLAPARLASTLRRVNCAVMTTPPTVSDNCVHWKQYIVDTVLVNGRSRG